MFNLAVVIYFAFLFLAGTAQKNNIFESVDVESSGTNIANEVHRGDGFFLIPEQDDKKILNPEHPFDSVRGHTEISLNETTTCTKDTERLLIANEDIRMELSIINIQYLENASIQKACKRDGTFSNCRFDFRLFPNELKSVCENHGGSYYETEHSISCNKRSTKESLYYQFDHYPSCMSTTCEMADMTKMVSERIEFISQNIGEYLGFDCLADEEILRHANDYDYDNYASSAERTGMKNISSWLWWIQRIAVTIFLLLQIDSKTQN
ncbi:MAG: hypothetical protein ACI8RD_009240 [Bacillariaceae sp.]|jgi:hypothetical protein